MSFSHHSYRRTGGTFGEQKIQAEFSFSRISQEDIIMKALKLSLLLFFIKIFFYSFHNMWTPPLCLQEHCECWFRDPDIYCHDRAIAWPVLRNTFPCGDHSRVSPLLYQCQLSLETNICRSKQFLLWLDFISYLISSFPFKIPWKYKILTIWWK